MNEYERGKRDGYRMAATGKADLPAGEQCPCGEWVVYPSARAAPTGDAVPVARPRTTALEIVVWRDALTRDLADGGATAAAWARCYGHLVLDSLEHYYRAAPAKGDTPSVVRDALRELVACKDLKAIIESNAHELDGPGGNPIHWCRVCHAKEEYERRQPLAWEAARAALAPAGESAVPDKGTL